MNEITDKHSCNKYKQTESKEMHKGLENRTQGAVTLSGLSRDTSKKSTLMGLGQGET